MDGWIDRPKVECTDAQTDRQMNEWTEKQIDGLTDRQTDGLTHGWVDRWMYGWIDRHKGECTDGQTADGWMNGLTD